MLLFAIRGRGISRGEEKEGLKFQFANGIFYGSQRMMKDSTGGKNYATRED
jgi:hypothetical protein